MQNSYKLQIIPYDCQIKKKLKLEKLKSIIKKDEVTTINSENR